MVATRPNFGSGVAGAADGLLAAAGGLRRVPVARLAGLDLGGAGDEALHLGAVDRLPLEQRPGDEVETGAVLAQRVAAAVLLLPQDPLDLLVDDPSRLVAVVPGVHEVLAEEHLALRAPGHRP